MGKYDPIRRFLESAGSESFEASFSQVEEILGFELPKSAYRHQAWWANETHGSHSHSRSWQDAGWETCQVNTNRRTVRFERRHRPDKASATSNPIVLAGPDLWKQAEEVTGITDREVLVETALLALVQREAGRQLAAMGGTMPDIKAPPRRRFTW